MSLVRELDSYFTAYLLESLFVSPYFQSSQTSVKLLGVVHSFRTKHDLLKDPWLGGYISHAETQLRASLGETTFEAAFLEGQTMSLDKALDLALRMVEDM